jgi:type 1 glutamine amidotransferase
MRSPASAIRWFFVLIGGAGLACSSDGADDGSTATPFGGAMPTPSPSSGGPSGAGGSPSMGIQGTPAQNPIGAPLAPGIGMASNNGIGGAPPDSNGGAGPDVAQPGPAVLENVLVYSRTVGYRHDAIGPAIEAIRQLGTAGGGFAVTATEDPAQFNDALLARFDVVVFLSTTMDVLDDTQQAAFQRYIRAGGGWVGVHAATDTEYGWPWYGQLIGGNAWFKSHPEIQTVTLNVETAAHASTAHLPATFQLQDEWYNFQANPRTSVTVLLTLDESSYSPGVDAMGDHPIAWFHEFDGGRAWYTALGHRQELYQDPSFTQHLLGGIRWAAGVAL